MTTPPIEIGFAGLGAMGEPMALNLVKAGHRLHVWNRTAEKCAKLAAAGARVAASPGALLSSCEIVFVMLADGAAIDAVLARGTGAFERNVVGRTIVNTATVSPRYSQGLETDIRDAGGFYVEAPVSGSRKPAEAGQLVAMLAGDPGAVERVKPLFAPMTRATVASGKVPGALTMKFAVNIFLIASVTGLVESANFAKSQGLDMATWASIVNASQMASDISRVKVEKLIAGDFAAQAAISNVFESNRLIVDAAHDAGVRTPLMEACLALYRRTVDLDLAGADMISVLHAFAHAKTDEF